MRANASSVLGIDFFCGEVEAAAHAVVERALSGEGGYACLGNVHVLMTAQRSEEMRNAMDDAWLNFPDGAPVAWLQRRAGRADAARIAGPDLFGRVVAVGRHKGLRHYFFGSTPEVLSKLQAQ